MTTLSSTKRAVEDWILDDPDEVTADDLRALLALAESGDEDAAAELADSFAGSLTFGTAGLRGKMGAGPNRMNRAVVIKAAAGLSRFLAEELPEGFTVVIGYDGRHGSKQFALDTAAVVEAAGGRALLFDRETPTPVVAFALRHLGADAAVMVTASHNPASDNGYKVYLGGRVVEGPGQGAQIVPPYDARILSCIESVPSATEVPRAEGGWETIGDEVLDAYVERVKQIVPRPRADLNIALTVMHGVGGDLATRVLEECGFSNVSVVAEQQQMDPDFPTVDFPNPEEAGALDMVLALAQEKNADIVLALDPDADRVSMALPDEDGHWSQLTGDEVGALLGDYKTQQAIAEGRSAVFANSLVSSRLLGEIAAQRGLDHAETLTGFKWISRVPDLTFGYEEALGYCVDPGFVRDKDGISAAATLAYLAAEAKANGSTLRDRLDELAEEFGLHATAPLTIRVENPQLLAEAVESLRARGIPELAGSPVVKTIDLAKGNPPTNGLLYLTANNDRVVVRPSGTEPKLKCYLEVVEPVKDGNVTEARTSADQKLGLLKQDMRDLISL